MVKHGLLVQPRSFIKTLFQVTVTGTLDFHSIRTYEGTSMRVGAVVVVVTWIEIL